MHRLPYLLLVIFCKSPVISDSFAERDLKLKAFYVFSPPYSCGAFHRKWALSGKGGSRIFTAVKYVLF